MGKVEEYHNEADALIKQGKYEEALVYYDKAIELNPKDEDGWIRKGNTLRDLKSYDEAIQLNPTGTPKALQPPLAYSRARQSLSPKIPPPD